MITFNLPVCAGFSRSPQPGLWLGPQLHGTCGHLVTLSNWEEHQRGFLICLHCTVILNDCLWMPYQNGIFPYRHSVRILMSRRRFWGTLLRIAVFQPHQPDAAATLHRFRLLHFPEAVRWGACPVCTDEA